MMRCASVYRLAVFYFQAEDGIRDYKGTGVQTCALPISLLAPGPKARSFVEGDCAHARIAPEQVTAFGRHVVKDGDEHQCADALALGVRTRGHPAQAPRRSVAPGAGRDSSFGRVKRCRIAEHRRHANDSTVGALDGAESCRARLVVLLEGHLFDALVWPEDGVAYRVARNCRDQLDVHFHTAERTDGSRDAPAHLLRRSRFLVVRAKARFGGDSKVRLGVIRAN